MKKTLAALVMGVVLSGCATSDYTSGKDFPSSSVPRIVKGKTSSDELKALFGEPFAKSPINETDEKWIYTYSKGSAHAQNYVVTMKITTTGIQKTLDVLIRNNTVINYTFTEGPTPGSVTATE